MFNIPVDAITIDDVNLFCQSGVRENVILDFKKEFPAKLEKTIAALANTYGGMILIGVDETVAGAPVLPMVGIELAPGLRERVIQKAISAIYPPVLPEVKVVEFKSRTDLTAPDRAVIAVRIHESDTAHAVDNRTTVYLRVDNITDPYRKATLEEIELFRNKREPAVTARSRSIEIAAGRARRYFIEVRKIKSIPTSEPAGRFRLWSVPTYPRGPLMDVRNVRDAATSCVVVPGLVMSTFPDGNSVPIAGGVYFDSRHDDRFFYSEVHEDGLAYHEVGFWWDSSVSKVLVSSNIVARLLMAGLSFGVQLYERLGYFGLVDYHFELNGVEGRFLCETPASPSAFYCRDNDVVVELHDTVPALAEDVPNRCKQMLRDVYWAFGANVDDVTLGPQIQAAAYQVLQR